MALQYGMNLTQSDMQNLLEQNDKTQNGIRTWRQRIGGASLGFGAQSDALVTDYSDAIAQAYQSNLAQNNAIMSSGLSYGNTKELLSASRRDLQTAYDTYVRNYSADVSALTENYGKELTGINDELATRAQNFVDLYNNAYKYLSEELYGSTREKSTGENTVANGLQIPEYETVNYLQENGLDWLITTGEDGEESILSWDDASKRLFDENNALTAEGTKFFDQIFNARPDGYTRERDEDDTRDGRTRGFDEWLSETSPKLREWAASQDAYNYTFKGSNLGTAKTLVGLGSTDDTFAPYEYIDENTVKKFDALASSVNIGKNNDFIKMARDAVEGPRNHYQSIMDESGGNVAIAMKISARQDYERAVKKAQEYEREYLSQLETAMSDLRETFKSMVGSNAYNEFMNQSSVAGFIDAYDRLLKTVSRQKENSLLVSSNAGQFERIYKELHNLMDEYIKGVESTAKSGF